MYPQENENVGLTLLRLSNQLRFCADQIASSCGQELNGMQGFILCHLHKAMKERKPIYQKDIERMLRVSRSTVSGILTVMEKRGLILRQPVSQDGRLKQIVLTQSAWALQNDIFERLSGMGQGLKDCLTEEEQDQFFHIAGKLQRHLQKKTEQNHKTAAK